MSMSKLINLATNIASFIFKSIYSKVYPTEFNNTY